MILIAARGSKVSNVSDQNQLVENIPRVNSTVDLERLNNFTIEQSLQPSINLNHITSQGILPLPLTVISILPSGSCTQHISTAPNGYIGVHQGSDRTINWDFFIFGANKQLYNYWRYRVTVNGQKIFEDHCDYEPNASINSINTKPSNYVYIQVIATEPSGEFPQIQATLKAR